MVGRLIEWGKLTRKLYSLFSGSSTGWVRARRPLDLFRIQHFSWGSAFEDREDSGVACGHVGRPVRIFMPRDRLAGGDLKAMVRAGHNLL